MNHQIISGLKDKKVLITGATGGIGSCLVQIFAKEGATLGIHYHRNEEQAKLLSRNIEIDGGRAECFQADLLSTNKLSLVQKFIERFQCSELSSVKLDSSLGNRKFNSPSFPKPSSLRAIAS